MNTRCAIVLGVAFSVVALGCDSNLPARPVPDVPDAAPGEGDLDGDAVFDSRDNCPAVANHDQLDADHDGIGDLCDPDMRPLPDAGTVDAPGCSTDGPLACPAPLACPSTASLPAARLYEDYVIDGARFFTGEARSWTWTVTGGPCDQLFASQGKPTSFALAGHDTSQLTFRASQVGDYAVGLSVVTAAGDHLSCTFIVHVAGVGLRVELCWDTSGRDDLDLHLHSPHSTKNWFSETDDCYYANCESVSLSHVDWGYPASPLPACGGGPEGAWWAEIGFCPNPRLDIGNSDSLGLSEQINIDRPGDGATYRVMANYFSGRGEAHPMATIYCQGKLVASFGGDPDRVPGFNRPGGDFTGSMWRIADITAHIDPAWGTACDVSALHPPGQAEGYDVRYGDMTY